MTDDKWKQHGVQHLGFITMVTTKTSIHCRHALYYVITQMVYSWLDKKQLTNMKVLIPACFYTKVTNTIPAQEVASVWPVVVATAGCDLPKPWHVIHDVFYADATAWSHSWCHSLDHQYSRWNHSEWWSRIWAGWILQAMSWTRDRKNYG